MSIEEDVVDLIADRQGIAPERITPDMSFPQLGIDGDDALELIEELCDRYSIDLGEIDLRRYTVGPEGWGIGLNSPPRQFISIKWSTPFPVDLLVKDLIRSAELRRWFDPAPAFRANW
jgi:acyl carrier protein